MVKYLYISLFVSLCFFQSCKPNPSDSFSVKSQVLDNAPKFEKQAVYLVTDPEVSQKIHLIKNSPVTDTSIYQNPSDKDIVLVVAFDEGHELYDSETGLTYLVARGVDTSGLQLAGSGGLSSLVREGSDDFRIREHSTPTSIPPNSKVLVNPSIQAKKTKRPDLNPVKAEEGVSLNYVPLPIGPNQIVAAAKGAVEVKGPILTLYLSSTRETATSRINKFFQNQLFGDPATRVKARKTPQTLVRETPLTTKGNSPLQGVLYEHSFTPPRDKPGETDLERNKDRTLVLFFGGSGRRTEAWAPEVASFYVNRYDVDVISYNYRGYGASAGSPSEKSIYEDAVQAYEHAISLGYKPENIVLHGFSMGAAPASHLALKMMEKGAKPKGLILDRPMENTVAGIRGHLPVPNSLAKAISQRTGTMDAPVRLADFVASKDKDFLNVVILRNDDFSKAGADDLSRRSGNNFEVASGDKSPHEYMGMDFYNTRVKRAEDVKESTGGINRVMGSEGVDGRLPSFIMLKAFASDHPNPQVRVLADSILSHSQDPKKAIGIKNLLDHLRTLNVADIDRVLTNEKILGKLVMPGGFISDKSLSNFSKNKLTALEGKNSQQAADALIAAASK